MKQPPLYIQQICAKVAAGRIKAPKGKVTIVDVRHDWWCTKLINDGTCICRPTFATREAQTSK
jgi:hypothetical protein